MPTDKVLLDIRDAENIFEQLNTMYEALKAVGTTPKERAYVVRGMVKLRVAINTAKGLYDLDKD